MSVGDPRAAAGGVESDDLDSGAIVLWTFVSVICVVIVMLIAAALYNWTDRSLYQQRVVARQPTASNDVIHRQQGILEGYAPPQAGSDYYRIPIDQAKTLVLNELTSKQASE